MKYFLICCTCLIIGTWNDCRAQRFTNLDELQPETTYDNIHVQALDSDEQASTFVIWVKKEVGAHYHKDHTEVVYVMEGHGTMTLGDTSRAIGPGDYVFIPRGTHHSVVVQGDEPMKVISIQTPAFDGSDRIFVTQ